ncbi:MAG: hypothetical protein U5N86_07415, partial [Planctomycetota bacterium]|nr:hypothetical protein [Planctomycetota bacterium]
MNEYLAVTYYDLVVHKNLFEYMSSGFLRNEHKSVRVNIGVTDIDLPKSVLRIDGRTRADDVPPPLFPHARAAVSESDYRRGSCMVGDSSGKINSSLRSAALKLKAALILRSTSIMLSVVLVCLLCAFAADRFIGLQHTTRLVVLLFAFLFVIGYPLVRGVLPAVRSYSGQALPAQLNEPSLPSTVFSKQRPGRTLN